MNNSDGKVQHPAAGNSGPLDGAGVCTQESTQTHERRGCGSSFRVGVGVGRREKCSASTPALVLTYIEPALALLQA